jgi:hypothetical protein
MQIQTSLKPSLAACLLVIGLCLLPGCGKSEVSGRVTVQGEPIADGRIVFIAEDGHLDSSPIQDGAYLVRRPPIGKVKITVTSTPPAFNNPRAAGSGKPERFGNHKVPETDPNRKFVPVPFKYSDEKTTDLTYEVTSGKQEHNIDLTP